MLAGLSPLAAIVASRHTRCLIWDATLEAPIYPKTDIRPDGAGLPQVFSQKTELWEASTASPIDRAKGFGIDKSF
jgi:hypothetical protein